MITTYINFIRDVRNLSEKTCSNYEFCLRAFAHWMRENMDAPAWSSVQVDDLEKYVASLKKEGLSPVSINYYITVLRVFFDYLVRFKGLRENPALFIGKLRVPVRLPKYIEDATIRKVIDHFSEPLFRHRRSRITIALAYFAGLRASELSNLTWDDIHLDERFIRVIGKGNKERLIPICEDLRLELISWRAYGIMFFNSFAPNDVICKRNGAHADVRLIQDVVYYTLHRFCPKDLCHPHALRHSFATNLMRKGVALPVIQKLMGHSNINTTMVYLTVTSDMMISEFNKAFTL